MKATIEFELPAEQDAYLDAINGSRWKEVMRSFEWYLMVLRDTGENSDLRQAYDHIRRKLRENQQAAGLTYATVKSLKKDQSRSDAYWAKRLDEYLEKLGIPEMMAEYEQENPPHIKPKRQRRRTVKAAQKPGTQHNTPPTQQE